MSDPGHVDHILNAVALDGMSEAVAVVTPGFAVRFGNRRFGAMARLVDGGRLSAPVARAVGTLMHQGGGRHRLSLEDADGVEELVYDLVLVPLTGGDGLLTVLDHTLESGLRAALTESRARFKSLVEISSDHAWEVGGDGTFTFVAPEGFLGYGPKDLIGTRPEMLIDPERFDGPVLPFTTPAPLPPTDIWLKDADGRLVCLEIAAVPLLGHDGAWRGARGVCRDVTDVRSFQSEGAEARVRERTLARIVRLFRREVDPEAMIKAASTAITHGLGATGCRIYGTTTPQAKVVTRPNFRQESGFGIAGSDRETDRLLETLLVDPDQVLHGEVGGLHALAAAMAYGDRVNGAVIVWRNPDRQPFEQAENRLLAAVAGHMGVALEQLYNHRMLVEVSRTDPLTGLFNRRAFYDDINRRIHRMERSGKKAALAFVDLDNFKAVNDLRGHDAGDEALLMVADILKGNTRATDIVARLGGDEFAVWLEDADTEVGVNRAKVFLAASTVLRPYSGAPDKPLTLSIGIAIYDPAWREDLNQFISRADAAMYEIKRTGKGTFGLAASPEEGGTP